MTKLGLNSKGKPRRQSHEISDKPGGPTCEERKANIKDRANKSDHQITRTVTGKEDSRTQFDLSTKSGWTGYARQGLSSETRGDSMVQTHVCKKKIHFQCVVG